MIINTNVSAMNAHRQMGVNQQESQSAMEKLSSGQQINKAGDDAAGLSISEKMRGQIRGLEQASNNAQDSISLIQTAEGALDESHSILQRMRELSVQSANDTNVGEDREALQAEVDELAGELSRIADNTEFNSQELLNDSFDGTFQIGANEGQNMDLSIGDMGAEALGVAFSETTTMGTDGTQLDGALAADTSYDVVSFEAVDGGDVGGHEYGLADASGDIVATSTDGSSYEILDSASSVEELDTATTGGNTVDFTDNSVTTGQVSVSEEDTDNNEVEITAAGGVDISTQETANAAISDIDSAISSVSEQRSGLGAVQNRLEHTISNLDNASENLSAAESRIRDTDMAEAMMDQTQANILNQASQSMLAQANQQPQQVLQLLQ